MWMLLANALGATTYEDAMAARDAAGAGTEAQQAAARRAVIHEWGTFTSLHAPDGRALTWRASTNTHALPPFVDAVQRGGPDAYVGPVSCEHAGRPGVDRAKGTCFARVRMETPVIYVHADAPARLRVRVGFEQGFHTEWYPSVRWEGMEAGQHVLDWGWISAEPGSTDPLPVQGPESPYYAARAVDASLLRVDDQVERFLFYRGIGGFTPGVHPRTSDDAVTWDGVGADTLVVYERSPDRTGVAVLRGPGTVRRASLTSGDPRDALRELLLAEGLFADEVEAMLATWEADWFEPGLRAFHLLPRAEIDRRLPLTVEPAPAGVVRVIVARAELLRPAQVTAALAASDDATLERHGRFGEAVLALAGRRGALERPVGVD